MDKTNEEKIEAIAEHFKGIMETLGLDLDDPSLQRSPERIAKMYVNEQFAGLQEKNFPSITSFPNPSSGQSFVHVHDILVHSTCEHHFVPMVGKAEIAYLPKKEIIGLSKIHHIVQYFSRRPQLQERLTLDIAYALKKALKTEDLAIRLRLKHFCVAMRGARDEDSLTDSSELFGAFATDASLQLRFFSK